jgi:4-carboxymuconolactone decarboxylase
MVRLPDPTASLAGADRDIYEEMLTRRRSRGSGIYGPYPPLLHHPVVAQKIEQLGFHYRFEGALPRHIYELVVLSFASFSGIAFEWLDHEEPARKAGVPDDVIEALREKAPDHGFPEPYGDVVRAVRIVSRYEVLPADLQQALVRAYGEKGLIEIVTLCGFYSLLGMVIRSFEIGAGDRPGSDP